MTGRIQAKMTLPATFRQSVSPLPWLMPPLLIESFTNSTMLCHRNHDCVGRHRERAVSVVRASSTKMGRLFDNQDFLTRGR